MIGSKEWKETMCADCLCLCFQFSEVDFEVAIAGSNKSHANYWL